MVHGLETLKRLNDEAAAKEQAGSVPEITPITSSSILHTLPGRYWLSWIDEHGVAQRQKAILCEHGVNDTLHVRTADDHWSIRSDSQWVPLHSLVGKATLEREKLPITNRDILTWSETCDRLLNALQTVIDSSRKRTHEEMKAVSERLTAMGSVVAGMELGEYEP